MSERVRVGDRVLAYDVQGPSDGSVVFLLHGTPGSRIGPRPRGLELELMGVRLITFDRPGYGGSTRLPRRRVADAAADVAAIADAVGLERFAVVGRSGGGPHALACAALLPDRVTAAASLVGLAPHAEDLDWFADMGEANRREYRTAWEAVHADGREALQQRLEHLTAELLRQMGDFVRNQHDPDMPEADRGVLADAGIRHALSQNFRQALANEQNLQHLDGRDDPILVGWLDDLLAFSDDWGFDLTEIRVPVLLWHGEQDRLLPAGHAKWLHRQIGDSALLIDPHSAHFGALDVLPAVLRWLTTAH
jgi:pimeloyl-ACP methyl ester carboxylesterase